jgi:hypothetical protein
MRNFSDKSYKENPNTYLMLLSFSVSNVSYGILIHAMEQSPSWEANRFEASQEIPRIL